MEEKKPESEYEFYKEQYEALKQKERDKEAPQGAVWVKANIRMPVEKKRTYIFRQANITIIPGN